MNREKLEEHHLYILLSIYNEEIAAKIKEYWGTAEFPNYAATKLLSASLMPTHAWDAILMLLREHNRIHPEYSNVELD